MIIANWLVRLSKKKTFSHPSHWDWDQSTQYYWQNLYIDIRPSECLFVCARMSKLWNVALIFFGVELMLEHWAYRITYFLLVSPHTHTHSHSRAPTLLCVHTVVGGSMLFPAVTLEMLSTFSSPSPSRSSVLYVNIKHSHIMWNSLVIRWMQPV